MTRTRAKSIWMSFLLPTVIRIVNSDDIYYGYRHLIKPGSDWTITELTASGGMIRVWLEHKLDSGSLCRTYFSVANPFLKCES